VTGENQNSKAFWGYVLAGGASSRFGNDKALAEFGGKAMLALMLRLIGVSGVGETNVIGAAEKYGRFGTPCVEDKWPGEGPLGGVITALRNTERSSGQRDWNLIVSCDMPFLTREWLRYLVERALASDAQVVLAHSAHGPEPLCACWKTDAVETLQRAFEDGVRRVTEGIALLRAEVLDERDWKRFDSAGRLFWNMNTLPDYETAKRILEAQEK
jgi:molybdopterin-guanine dinucleotide biosynthesis protein A